MYKIAAILYLICFLCYLLFSRSPDYFDSEITKGVVSQKAADSIQIDYQVDTVTYKITNRNWGASQVREGQNITVIYNPSSPSEGSLYTFFAYWLKLHELLVTASGFAILLFAAIFITGKEEPYYYSEDEKRKKRKYKD